MASARLSEPLPGRCAGFQQGEKVTNRSYGLYCVQHICVEIYCIYVQASNVKIEWTLHMTSTGSSHEVEREDGQSDGERREAGFGLRVRGIEGETLGVRDGLEGHTLLLLVLRILKRHCERRIGQDESGYVLREEHAAQILRINRRNRDSRVHTAQVCT